ncbi:kinase non-catalytic C-lobe domain-containing protein 1 isoform X2 [Hypomesus transpacificus]|uniref:kinase non-catalytic C-lobe domain-containing protein 1 isoform X2 n=1 Tax=Hypomesus transpacificus TaxID=137520 RepID=UPI001F085BC7|nr:kinase non-catalytic C-lobe domain-containing protein 1 isoform X2 [Hypomesus transpacificus]
MGTSETDAVVAYSGTEEEEEEYYEQEHLPPLLEDEENVSLADILSLRDSCLCEEEVWAVCVECVSALQSIGPSSLFHTLCITPDTLAFNAHGNVCFMEQLSDDPEGSFIPPEFDKTGCTFEGHVFSLGSTLSAALDFVIEPELEAELGEETQRLLEQMQEERPEDRPRPQDILSLAESKLAHTSSAAVCRKLSSIGRRVLSIESVSTFQGRHTPCIHCMHWYLLWSSVCVEPHGLRFSTDGPESSWEARWQQPKSSRQLHRTSSDDSTQDADPDPPGERLQSNGLSRRNVCGAWDVSLWTEVMGEGDGEGEAQGEDIFGAPSDCRSQNSSPVRRRAQDRSGRVRGALNRSCSVPDSNNPPSLPPTPHGDISVPVCDLTEIGAEGHVMSHRPVWSNRLHRGEQGKGPSDCSEPCGISVGDSGTREVTQDQPVCRGASESDTSHSGAQDRTSSSSSQDPEASLDSTSDETPAHNHLYTPNNHMTKSMLCLNEESQDEWISLRELLTQCGRRLSVNELWALCHTCLSTLQTYIDYPAFLCLETVYVGCKGEMLFLKSRNTGSCDAFFLAPEFQEHGIVTEKACVYGVAAILWATAKFSLTPNQKLAMPRKLKRLLLEMAKRTPIERPSIVMAKKSCRDYLFRQGTSAEIVWKKLISRVHQPHSRAVDREDRYGLDSERSSSEEPTHIKSGFVPTATESRLAPVPGPLPHSYPISRSLQLPEAFTSSATHFTPIILTQERDPDEECPPPASDSQGTVDEFTRGSHSQHAQDKDLDTTPRREAPPLTQEDRYLQSDRQGGSLVNQRATPNFSFTASSANTLVSSPSLTASELSNREARIPPLLNSSCSHLTGCGVFNNFLLRQDLQTGCLTLVPVHISAPDATPKLEVSLPFSSHSLQGQPILPGELGGDFVGLTMTSRDQPTLCQESEAPQPYPDPRPITCSPPPDPTEPMSESSSGETCSRAEGESLSSPQIHPALQEVIALLRGEFAFDGYLENGEEDLAMGEYIFSLKDLQYHTFANVVKEKFRDLYWEEDLLGVLYCLVNYNLSSLVSNEQPPSKPRQRAANPPLRGRREEKEPVPRRPLDLNANVDLSDPGRPEVWERTDLGQEAGLRAPQTEPSHRDTEGRTVHAGKGSQQVIPVECLHHGCQGLGVKAAEDSAAGAMESGDHPVGGDDESPSEASSPWGRDEVPRGGHQGQTSPDCSEDMEDTDSLVSERLLSPSSGAEEQGLSPCPSWALAFHGEDCFSQEVVNYTLNLGQHAESPCLEQKTQELQQQLIIETRNLKKTRNFHQRLLHQERKNRGSETKLMLSKLKGQLEELKTKVEFLDSVKKYLEVLSIDRWGVEASLLPSLAARGPGSLKLQASEDSTVLSFGTGRGKTTLQAGSPFGLMAYLYARNAPLEGYIQQFLYTYRYFCAPEEFLQFLMDNFSRAAGSDSDIDGDSAKVYHRSLDLLEAWLADWKLVDFSPESSLHNTLENFLTSKVSPVDSRGESLLATLQRSPRKRWSQGSSSPISMQEEDLQSVHSLYRKNSIEDPGRKSFQWRFSRVVEPQASLPKEKAYSIAAALPRPCYSSLMEDLSSVCLRSEKRQPFSHNEHGAQHIAQQLTMLQQEMFQGCHPVHFLNSRAQGVRDKATCKSVSHHLPPAEGSSLFVCDGPTLDSPLQQLLRYADSVTNWVSAEIVICDSVKTQAALLTKFLLTAKHCYESRDFSTAMQILGGLENVIVRQLPAWKHLSAKVCEILEELRAVQVFLKSDNLCLMGGDQGRRRPTLPSAHILAMHLQQLEIGAFTLTSGAYKWPKLRTIAKVVSQVHAFQDSVFSYSADPELQAYLRLRIAHLSTCDVHLLAADNDANFHQLHAERHTRLIQDTLRRVKATFQ